MLHSALLHLAECNFHHTYIIYRILLLLNITIAYAMVTHSQLFVTLLMALHYASPLANEKETTHYCSHGHQLQLSTTIPSSNLLCLCFARPRKFCGAVAENHSTKRHRYNAHQDKESI